MRKYLVCDNSVEIDFSSPKSTDTSSVVPHGIRAVMINTEGMKACAM